MIMLLYGMGFRITSFGKIDPSPCVLFFRMYFPVSTQKTKANFKILQLNPTSITDVTKILSHFLLWKVCNRLKLNLCTCYFFFGKRVLFKLSFVCLFFLYKTLFFASGARTLNMDETDNIVFRRSVYLFILQTNTITQITTYMYY